jgi:two-component system, OmpR family, sensor kinase
MDDKIEWKALTREKERLLELLIHDLRGPLSVVSTGATILLRNINRYGPLTEKQRNVIGRISRNVKRAQSLLQEMLEVSKSEEGLFLKESFLVEKAFRESMMDVLEVSAPKTAEKFFHIENNGQFRRALKAQRIFMVIGGKYATSPFCHDQKKIQQIFRNLLSNALKHRRKRIDVSISGETDLLISVDDDGLGIPVVEQENVFGRFVRLDNTNNGVPGLGLGLAGLKVLVGAMGGKITFVSRKEIGTRFTVQIPPLDLSSW